MGRNPMTHNGFPPANYSPRTCDPLRTPASKPLTVWQVGMRILLLLTALIAGICLWQL